ncbi:MAG: PAC2 family protein [Actinomycetota bacterium]
MAEVQWQWRPEGAKPARHGGPILIASFGGWNDAGDAATTVVEHLETIWDTRAFAQIDPEEFHDFTSSRPQIRLIDDDRVIRWPSHTFSWSDLHGTDGVILLRAVEPQLRWRTYCGLILDLARELECGLVVTLGALLADVPHTRPSRVIGTAYDPEVAARLRLEPSTYQGPTGIVGVLHTLCRDAEIDSASIWATVPAYLPSAPAPLAALALLERVGPLVGAATEPGELREALVGYEQAINQMIEEDESTVEYVQRLEEIFDSDPPRSAQIEEQLDPQAFVEEVERFLRDK